MNSRAYQPNFSRGELAPALYGRFDVDAWQSAVKKARNVVVLKYGGLTKRPGTQLVAEVVDAIGPNRLVPFQFSLTQTYALEMGNGYMSPCANGGRLVETELIVTGISNAAHAVVSAAYHGYIVGNFIYFSGVAGGIGGLLNGRAWKVLSVIDDHTFTIDADTTGLGSFAGATGGIERTAPPEAPPAPPPITEPVPEPDPPVTIGGGGGYWHGNRVADY